MNNSFRWFTVVFLVFVIGAAQAQDKVKEKEWTPLFDGKTMEGWEKVGNEQSVWEVKEGALCGSGPASMV